MVFPLPRVPLASRLALVVASLLVLLSAQTHLAVADEGHGLRLTPEATDADELESWIAAPIRPELHDEVAAAMPENLPIYEIRATLDVGGPSVTGTLTLHYVNTTGETLDSLPFRLYANGPDEEHDAVTVDDVTVNGSPVTPAMSVMDSVLEIPLEGGLAEGDAVQIAMSFTTVPPEDSRDHYGIFNINSDTGSWALAHWYPVLAGRDPETGWVLDPPSRNGDPIFSGTALYDVTLAAPAEWEVVTTGVPHGDATTGDDVVTQRYVSGPVRDFTIVADEQFEVATAEVDGVVVSSWYNPGEEEVGEASAEYAAQAIELFNDLLGPYPYTTLDLVPVPMYGAAGCEFPQLIYIGHDYYEEPLDTDVPNALDFTIAHEVVHQWFYGLVGNNQYAHAFIDEGLTQYLSSEIYFGLAYDQEAADAASQAFLHRPFERFVEAGDDQVVDQPTDDFEAGWAYSFAAYVKAPLGFAAIHEEIGDEAFFAGLQTYVDAFTFGVATPEDLLGALEEASGEDLDAIWRHWFEETNGEEDI